MTKQTGQCSCGNVAFDITGKPLARLYCHCTICQDFNGAAFGDVVFYDAKSVDAPSEGIVDFRSYKAKSPVLRGKCSKCGDPVLERTVSGPKFWIVPSSAHSAKAKLPPSAAHIYYESRTADVADNIPKHLSPFKSNLVAAKHLIFAKLFGPRG